MAIFAVPSVQGEEQQRPSVLLLTLTSQGGWVPAQLCGSLHFPVLWVTPESQPFVGNMSHGFLFNDSYYYS